MGERLDVLRARAIGASLPMLPLGAVADPAGRITDLRIVSRCFGSAAWGSNEARLVGGRSATATPPSRTEAATHASGGTP